MVSVITNVMQTCIIKSFNNGGFYFGPDRPDLALLAVDMRGLAKYALALNTDIRQEGEMVATAGFPMGPSLLYLEGNQLDHLAPTLQSGIISAVLPFPDTHAHGYLANIMVQCGASGSPVFLPETGEVIGAIHSKRMDHSELSLDLPEPITVPVPINFSHVVPSHYLKDMIEKSTDKLMPFVTNSAPSIDEVLDNVPKNPQMPFTAGRCLSVTMPLDE